MRSFTQLAPGLAALVGYVSAHGQIAGITTADGVFHKGFNPKEAASNQQTVGWDNRKDQDNGPIMPAKYTDPDIICHVGATPAPLSADVKAGDPIEIHWTGDWPGSHDGPLMTFLAACPGNDCTTVDKTTLKFFKISEEGLLDGTSQPKKWATGAMIKNNFTANTIIPASIVAGQYVLRHEAIALHEANRDGGAQNYPFCLNLNIASTGTVAPPGIEATKFYTPTDPGIKLDIYNKLDKYEFPGPALFTG